MTEHCFENPNSTHTNKHNKSSDFAIFYTIFSHPLYFSYLIFFSPYLLKLLSFLSPLFITTSLLLLSLLTTIIPLSSILNSKQGFLLTTYGILLEKLCPEFDIEGEKLPPIEEFEVYKIVFETPTIEVIEDNPDENGRLEEDPVGFSEERETGDANPDKVNEQVKKLKTTQMKMGLDSELKVSEAFSQTVGGQQPCLRSFGSTRKETEWRRTLACKLFEERHSSSISSVNGCGNYEERMDLLWEAHETEPNRGKTKGMRRREKAQVSDDEFDQDDDFDGNGRLCCLQALKLSAGKMNLNMGRPNLLKFGKAFKGIGWLRSHIRRQGKKGYNK